jgi:hypothetical protein
LYNDTDGSGYDFCSLINQFVVYRPGETNMTVYDIFFTTSKTYDSVNDFILSSITEVICDPQSNTISVIGPDASIPDPIPRIVVISGWTSNNQDDRNIIYRSSDNANNTNLHPVFMGELNIISILGNASFPDFTTVLTKEIQMNFNTSKISNSTTQFKYTLSSTSKYNQSLSASKSANIYIYALNQSFSVSTVNSTKQTVSVDTPVSIDSLLAVSGPIISTNLSDDSLNHVTLQQKVEIVRSNFKVYSESKTSGPMQIKYSSTSPGTYDIFYNYGKLYANYVKVGTNQVGANIQIQDVEIFWDANSNLFTALAVFIGANNNCYLSTYINIIYPYSTFDPVENVQLLRTGGASNCYDSIRYYSDVNNLGSVLFLYSSISKKLDYTYDSFLYEYEPEIFNIDQGVTAYDYILANSTSLVLFYRNSAEFRKVVYNNVFDRPVPSSIPMTPLFSTNQIKCGNTLCVC